MALLPENVNPEEHMYLEVESILAHRKEDSKDLYLVKWKNRDAEFNEWVQSDNFQDSTPIKEYWKSKTGSKRKRVVKAAETVKRVKPAKRVRFDGVTKTNV